MEGCEYSLPVELWWQVLVNVSPRDLCKVVLTSRHMNRVASLPELWTGMKIKRRKMLEKGLAEFYNINRFKKVKEISFDSMELELEEIERLLKEIPGSPLENANFRSTNLRGVSTELLARAVSHLHIVNMGFTHLTTEQCIAIMEASHFSETLTNLNLKHVYLGKVPPELLANSISRLQDVNLLDSELTTEQCVTLMKASLSSATLKVLNLWKVDLSEIPAELLANSISRLQGVNLWGTYLTTEQCVPILKANLSPGILTNINLTCVNLSKVPAKLLANSISRSQVVNLSSTDLTTEQCVAIIKTSLSSTTLTNLNLEYVDLGKVPADLLAHSISRLQVVNLEFTHLTTEQCVALLKASLSSATLTNVNLKFVNLSKVPAELLANSISRLQVVNLYETDLTTEQCVALLKASLSYATLTNLILWGVDLSNVPAELLANSRSAKYKLSIGGTRLTKDQCVALLKASRSSKTSTIKDSI